MSYSPCDSQMSPDPLRYILCTLLVMNILSLPTLSLICPSTIPWRTFVSTIIVIIKSILTLDSVMSIPFLAYGEPWGSRVHSGGVIIPCTECNKLFPQIHQMRQNVLTKKKKKRKKQNQQQAFICFLSNLLPHTVFLTC